jgi:hypothetical protein
MPETARVVVRRVARAHVLNSMQNFNLRETFRGFSSFHARDAVVVAAQMERRTFDPELVLAVAARCSWGFPQVLLCRPCFKGKPFPTLFWLTCPCVTAACGRLESVGGVGLLEAFLNERPREYRAYTTKYRLARLSVITPVEQFFLRRYQPKIWSVLERTGIGGIRTAQPLTVKCLHLQTGTMLGLPGHPARRWLIEKLGPLRCKDGACRSFSHGAMCH